jgi:hypothetical protein
VDLNPDLEDMLVFSTHPLFSMTQTWTWTFPFDETNQIQFESSSAEAEHNGTLAYLGRVWKAQKNAPLDSSELSNTDQILDYATRFATPNNKDTTNLVLWIGVVGRDAIWPLGFQKVCNVMLYRSALQYGSRRQ